MITILSPIRIIVMLDHEKVDITKLCSLITAIFGLSKSLMLVCAYILVF